MWCVFVADDEDGLNEICVATFDRFEDAKEYMVMLVTNPKIIAKKWIYIRWV